MICIKIGELSVTRFGSNIASNPEVLMITVTLITQQPGETIFLNFIYTLHQFSNCMPKNNDASYIITCLWLRD
jgi:hypothetical protein